MSDPDSYFFKKEIKKPNNKIKYTANRNMSRKDYEEDESTKKDKQTPGVIKVGL